MSLALLERVQQACAFFGMQAEYLPVSEAVPYELLLVDARSAPEQPELPVRVYFAGDVLAQLNLPEAPVPLAETLSFLSPLDLTVSEAVRFEVAQLLMVLNTLMPTGDFGIDADNEILCRYTLLNESRELEPLLAVRVLRVLSFFIEQFRPLILAVVEGRERAEACIARLEQELVAAAHR